MSSHGFFKMASGILIRFRDHHHQCLWQFTIASKHQLQITSGGPARHRSCPPTKHGTRKITPLRRIIFKIIMCLGSMLNVQGLNPLVDGTNLAALGFWYVPPAIRNWVFQSHLTFPPSGNPCCRSRYSLHGRVVRPDTRGPGWELVQDPEGSWGH